MTGTGSPLPDPNRSGPSQLVKVADRNFLIDCGRGCLMRLAAAGAPPITIERLLLTHLHSDHVTDVNDLITTRWVQGFPAPPLPIVGPEGTENFIENTLKMLEPDIGYRIENNKIVPGMSKVEVGGVFAFQSILENPFLPLAYREYFPSERKEILSDDNDKNVYYVFKNVSNEVKCGWWICNYGDGILDKTFLSYSAAVNYVKKTEKKNYIQKKTVTIVDKGKKQTISAEKNVLDELSKVTKDYKDGKISESEFEKRKEEILR